MFSLRTFVQFSALALTFVAAVFLARSNLGLGAEAIVELSSTKLDYNSDVVRNLAQQRADTWTGFAFLLLAFGLQMGNALWPLRYADLEVHRPSAAYAFILCLVLGFGAHHLSNEMARDTQARVKQVLEAPVPALPKPAPRNQ